MCGVLSYVGVGKGRSTFVCFKVILLRFFLNAYASLSVEYSVRRSVASGRTRHAVAPSRMQRVLPCQPGRALRCVRRSIDAGADPSGL